ncbi:MAG: hypothetical protein OXN17_08340 [Candidatus Poribacteria bacterium]|nr:hypothetical protein [Candidatus Poribacteria bacterium]MDE0505414.1 hypothetical protein [Candidatus Poribacteria bacterium]
MQELLWNVTKFNHIFSYPSDAGDGTESHAQDMVNLRVDRWGHLRLRPVIRALQMREQSDIAGEDIGLLGVAAAAGKLFWLQSDGRLMVANGLPADPVEVDIGALDTLSGRLTAIDIGGNTIITSERDDRGLVVRDDVFDTLGVNAVEPLGQLPIPTGVRFTYDDPAFSLRNLLFKLTVSGKGVLGPLESQATESHAVPLPSRRSVSDPVNPDIEITINAVIPDDSRITGVHLWLANQFPVNPDSGVESVYHQAYTRDVNPGQELAFTYTWSEIVELDGAIRLRDNSPMPENANHVTLYNDRLFSGVGRELRFSDVRNAIPYWGTWPVLNSITTGHRIEFSAGYRGILLFGGADNLYRLSGASPHTYRYDRISSRGPVSSHAWGVLEKAFGFVGSDGLYLTDGTQAPEIAPQLKGYFNRYEVQDGFVGMLPNKASLWGVNRRDKSTNALDTIYFVNDGNDWVRLAVGDDGTRIRQYTSVKLDPLTGVIADGQPAPRLIDWVVDDETVDGITKYTGQQDASTEQIAWSWESQQLDWNSQGLGSEMKTFKELLIDGKAENDITAVFYIDEGDPVEKAITADRMGGERFDYVRVRIDRRGFALRLKITGTGNLTIRGLKVRAYV